MYLQPPPAHTGMMVVWGGGGQGEGLGSFVPTFEVLPSSLQCTGFAGSLQLTGEAVGGF